MTHYSSRDKSEELLYLSFHYEEFSITPRSFEILPPSNRG
jgi:hypothetical protein